MSTFYQFKNKCITFKLSNGDKVTGIVRDVVNGFVKLSVAGKTVFVAIKAIVLFKRTSGLAC